MTTRKIRTKLVGKEEIFKVLALGEVTKLPVLLLGDPGVGKTQSLIDFAAAKYNYVKSDVKEKTFIIELDEGTKTSEIKGRVNMKNLLENKEYTLDAPIADAEFVLINEVDKGTSGVRNTLLSVMREKALFYGNEIKKCQWQVFAGSCNVIPTDELENPFWDRFVLTSKVDRVGADNFTQIWKNNTIVLDIPIPTKEEIDNTKVSDKGINKFIKVVYDVVSDRTASYLKTLTKAVKLVYDLDDIGSLMKCCELIAPSKLSNLSSKLETKRENAIKTKIDGIEGVLAGNNSSYSQVYLKQVVDDLEEISKIKTYSNQVSDLVTSIVNKLDDAICDDLDVIKNYFANNCKHNSELLISVPDGWLLELEQDVELT